MTAPTEAPRTEALRVGVLAAEPFAAADLYRRGVRAVELDRPVDLTDPSRADCRALDVVRSATAHGMRVGWELLAPPPSIAIGELGHLHPPRRVHAPDGPGLVAAWWDGFYLGRCCWRRGPGFTQIRDRRAGRLIRFTVTEPELIAAVTELDRGNHDLAREAARPLLDERLVLPLGAWLWLAPYRIVRWPTPSLTA